MTKLIIALLIFVTAGSVFFLYTQPKYDRIKDIQADISEFDQALNKAQELQELKQALLARYNTFDRTQLDRLSKLLPDHVDNVRLVLDLDSMAARYRMAVQNVTISRNDDAANTATVIGSLGAQASAYDSLTMQFNTRGTYTDFSRFIEDLETSLRIVDIASLSITPETVVLQEGVAVGEPTYKFNITLRTYWLK